MTIEDLILFLFKLGACSDARRWLQEQKSVQDAWDKASFFWLLWLLWKLGFISRGEYDLWIDEVFQDAIGRLVNDTDFAHYLRQCYTLEEVIQKLEQYRWLS
jgi:hypothetical protein